HERRAEGYLHAHRENERDRANNERIAARPRRTLQCRTGSLLKREGDHRRPLTRWRFDKPASRAGREPMLQSACAVAPRNGGEAGGREGDLIPVSLVRFSISALIATIAELPDIDSAAISGESVNG